MSKLNITPESLKLARKNQAKTEALLISVFGCKRVYAPYAAPTTASTEKIELPECHSLER